MDSTIIKKLKTDFPIPAQWKEVDFFSETVQIGDLQIHCVGYSYESNGTLVTGSAASSQEKPFDRAYFELLERLSIVEAMRSEKTFTCIKTGQTIRSKDLFPQSNSPEWNYARSNGVALGLTTDQASLRASQEAIERDIILRSWLGNFPPQELFLSHEELKYQKLLSPFYDMKSYAFPVIKNQTYVCMSVLFPLNDAHPQLHGFGAGSSVDLAQIKAAEEAIQRLAFLWGDNFCEDLTFQPTPLYHQNFFLQPTGKRQLKSWLNFSHESYPFNHLDVPVSFFDITPDFLKKYKVIKALSVECLALKFGKAAYQPFKDLSYDHSIHPIV